MASKIADAFVDISAQRGKLTQELNAGRGQINSFVTGSNRKLGEVGKGVGGIKIGALFGGGGGIGMALSATPVGAALVIAAEMVKDVVKVTAEGEKAVARLNAALKSTGQSADSKALTDYADALKDVYGADDDAIRKSMTLAINLGATGDNIKSVSQAAIGLADVMGGDLNAATEAVMKAQEGNFREFEKLIPAMKDATTSDQKLAMVSKLAAQGLAQKRAAAETLGGSIERVSLAVDDFEKSIGALISAPLTSFLNDVTGAIKSVTAGTEEAQRTFLGLSIAAQTVKKFALEFVTDDAGAAKVQAQIDELEAAREASMQRSVKTATEAMNKETNLRLKALRRVEDETRSTFGKIEDIYKNAQEAALKGGDIIGIGRDRPAEPKGNKFGDIGFKDDRAGAAAGPKSEGQKAAEGTPGGRRPDADRERIQDVAGGYTKNDPEGQLGENKGGELRQKGERLDREAMQYGPGERASAAESAAKAVIEGLTGQRPVRVKDENAEALLSAIQKLNGILPNLVGTFGN